jgi:hypothetical protein
MASLFFLYGEEKEKKHQDQAEKVALQGQNLRRASELIDS